MKLLRRQFLQLAGAAAAAPALPQLALALNYPTRPVRIVVGFAAGSAADILSRLIAQSLADRLGHPFIVENHGGAGGTLGTEMVVRAPADGYTLGYCGNADAVTATMYEKLSYNFMRDIAPIASMARGPLVLVVQPSFPARTLADFIAYTKSNPGKVAFASAGIGTIAHMAGELFMAKAEVKLVHVPYRGLGPAMTDLLGGQVQAIFSTMPPAIGHIRAGRLRPLGMTSTARFEALPDVPIIADFLPGYEASILSGLDAPRNAPAEIITMLNKEVSAIVAEPGMKARLLDLGSVPVAMTPAEFGKALADETEKWRKVIRTAGIKSE
jgi:tripartite-type tricarboxylate transporter receptor subunit TctC